MQRPADTARAFVQSLGVHALCLAVVFAGMLWTRSMPQVSVAGEPVEAMLVSAPEWYRPAPALPEPQPAPAAPPPQPRPEPRPQQAEEPPQPVPQAPPPQPDTLDRERAARLAQQQAEEKARAEERERQRQRQIELEAEFQRQEAERRERLRREQTEREQQLADVRRQREEAERARQREADKLRQLEDRRRASETPAPREAPPSPQVGNRGTDESLKGRYAVAIQQAVTQNWLRPESAPPGIRCTLRIVQIPGGEVIQVSVSTPCNADDLTRRSIEAAVLKAQPLPYRGFETVFEREITFNFRYDGN